MKNLAIIFFGISYYKNFSHWKGTKNIIDFYCSVSNYKKYMFDYFYSNGYEIDVFISTYNSEKNDELLNTYKPKDYIFFNFDPNINQRNNIFVEGMKICIEYSCKNMKKYDVILMTRFDLIFKIKFDNVHIDYNKMNIVSVLENNDLIDDNFYLFPFNKIKDFMIYCKKRNEIIKKDNYHNIIVEPLKKIFGDINYLKNEKTYVENLSFYKINRIYTNIDNIMPLIIDNIYNDIVYYNNDKNSSIKISDNIIYFKKINKSKCPFAWFGYNIENIGTYKISFDILSNKKIKKDFDNGIKLHNPVIMYNDFLNNVVPDVWCNIELIITVHNENDLFIFIFDNFDDTLEIKFKNIKIKENTYDDVIMGLFGFTRNFPSKYKINIKNIKKYINTPSIMYEDKNDVITEENLNIIYGDNSIVNIYNYNKMMYIEKINKLNIPQFNEFFQQGYRISSFFYNLKCITEIIEKNENFKENIIIILCRIDVGIKNIDINKIKKFLFTDNYDIIVHREDSKNGYDDKYFVLKSSSIKIFQNLYDDYDKYLNSYYHKQNKEKIVSTRPEDIFSHHFKKYNKKVIASEVLDYVFEHVCNKYCGHNGKNTAQ